ISDSIRAKSVGVNHHSQSSVGNQKMAQKQLSSSVHNAGSHKTKKVNSGPVGQASMPNEVTNPMIAKPRPHPHPCLQLDKTSSQAPVELVNDNMTVAALLAMSHGNNLKLPSQEVKELQPDNVGTGQNCDDKFPWYPYEDEDTYPGHYGEQASPSFILQVISLMTLTQNL
ncbi:hypothetical protein J3A83DRAFT_4211889, partial [Scleroderma citrinum]